MRNVLLFGGTTEGKQLSAFLEQLKITYFISVATTYGADVLPCDLKYGEILTGRMDVLAIENFLKKHGISFVIDATHPYAVEVTENINLACERQNVPHIRICRDTGVLDAGAVYAASMQEAVGYLQTQDGNILLTTGSKDLKIFTGLKQYKERIYARILPFEQSVEAAVQLGFLPSHLICKKGPFSVSENLEMLKQCNARFLVSKESGQAGGFPEKVQAAEALGVQLVVVKKPMDEGMKLEQAVQRIYQQFSQTE